MKTFALTEAELANDDESGTCPRCNGNGTINQCCDDMCRNEDFCMHGDGDVRCPVCKGQGEV